MQNAYRAGAAQVAFEFDAEKKRLVVRDDGCGIDSMETLLTMPESGWCAKTVAKELTVILITDLQKQPSN